MRYDTLKGKKPSKAIFVWLDCGCHHACCRAQWDISSKLCGSRREEGGEKRKEKREERREKRKERREKREEKREKRKERREKREEKREKRKEERGNDPMRLPRPVRLPRTRTAFRILPLAARLIMVSPCIPMLCEGAILR